MKAKTVLATNPPVASDPAPRVPVTEREPPRQARSVRTEGKLLAAALRVLEREGLERATVPRIAAEAGLAPGSLYRRFADKDDLLHATSLHLLDLVQAAEAEHLRTLRAGNTLSETTEALVGMLQQRYRKHPQTLRALGSLLEAQPASRFATEANERLSASLTLAADLLLTHRDSIRHPEPERAARFAVLSATSTIEAAHHPQSLWQTALSLNDKAFTAELTRQMVAYLRRKP